VRRSNGRRIPSLGEVRASAYIGLRDLIGSAVEEIDAELGDGYASQHPDLIGAALVSCALVALCDRLEEHAESVADAVHSVADTL
jgi:hypothetical protein